jgi:hypothetical protein
MRNGFLFSTARAVALLAIAGAPLVATAGAPSAPTAARSSGPPTVVANKTTRPEIRFLRFLDEFWQQAWNADFVVHDSGMTLEDAGGPGPRAVRAYDAGQLIGSGHYLELVRLDVPVPHLSPGDWPPAAGFSFEHFVTAGVLQGPTGRVTSLYGLVQRVALVPDGAAAIVVEGLTPLGVTATPDGAVAAAFEALDLLAGDADARFDGEPPLTPGADPCLCDEIYANEIDACLAEALACDLACAAAAIGGIIGCLALGPIAPPCIAAVLAAEVICIAACLARQRACNLRATNDWLDCWLECVP